MDRRYFIRSASLFAVSLTTAKLLASCSFNHQTEANSASTGTAIPETTNFTALDPEIKTLNFGIISTESQANQKPIWEPLVQAMSDVLGMPVNAFYATSYAAVVEAMRFGKVHAAWLGGKSYIEAARIANVEAFAITIANDGSKEYYAHLITNKNNPIVSEIEEGKGDQYILKNAANLTFAFNDPNSTSGFLVPSYYIFAKNNVNPNKAFDQLVFSGSHEATALAVVNNQVDVATNHSEILSRLEKTNPEAREQIKVIWTSVELPREPLAYRKDLPEELKEKIRNFFYNYKDKTVLAPLEWSGFEAAQDINWNSIRELEIGKQILEVQSNENMDKGKKDQKIKELQKQLEALS